MSAPHCMPTEVSLEMWRYAQVFMDAGFQFQAGTMMATATEYRPAGRIIDLPPDGRGGQYARITWRNTTMITSVTLEGHLPYLEDKLTLLAIENWISDQWLKRGEAIRLTRTPNGWCEIHVGDRVFSKRVYLKALEEATLKLADRP